MAQRVRTVWDFLTELTYVMAVLFLIVWLTGCAPQRRPDGTYPRAGWRSRQWPGNIIPLDQARCFGGGIGGCSWGGKAE